MTKIKHTLTRILLCLVIFSAFKANAQTALSYGDVAICGWNNNQVSTNRQIQVVLLKACSAGTVFKIGATGFYNNGTANAANNARATSGISKWTNTTGSTLPVGTVITMLNGSSGISCDVGTMSNVASTCVCGANGSPVVQSTSGGRFFIYYGGTTDGQGAGQDLLTTTNPTTLMGVPIMLFGFQGTQSGYTAFLTTSGSVGNFQTYLPSDLANYNIFHAGNAIGGYFTPARNSYSTASALRTALLTTSNWTTTSGTGTVSIPSGDFTLGTTPAFTGSTTLNACSAGAAVSINSNLAIIDAATSGSETWTVTTAPTNGTLGGFNAFAIANGGTVTPAGLTYTPNSGYTGTDNFTVRVTNASGGTASKTVTVTVNASPNAGTITVTSSPFLDSLCATAPLQLASSGTTGGTWSANNPSLVSSVSSTGLVSANTTTVAYPGGTAVIKYKVTTASCGSDSVAKTIYYRPISDTGTVTPLRSTGVSICIGDQITFSSNSTTDGLPRYGGVKYSHTWTTSNSSVASVNTSTGIVIAKAAGTTNIQYYTAPNGCGSFHTAGTTVTVNALPVVNITTTETSGTTNNDGVICNGASVKLAVSDLTGISSTLWDNGFATSSITVSPSANKSYTSFVTNTAGCTTTTITNIVVNNATSSTTTLTACGSYLWNGVTYNTTGTYTKTFANGNSVGCDSVATLNLTIKLPTSSTFTTSACGSYTWAAKGNKVYTASNNTDTIILKNAAGCDSVITLNLTIKVSPALASLGNALYFSNASNNLNYIDFNSSFYTATNYSTASNFTIESWIKPSDNNFRSFFSHKTAGASVDGYALFVSPPGNPNKLYLEVSNASLTSSGSLTAGQWNHVALVYAAGVATWYINGVASGSAAINITTNTGASHLGVLSGGGYEFNGGMDEFRIWNTVRTQAEIAANMNTELVGNEAGLYAYYNFNQGYAGSNNSGVTTLLDITANANNGTLNLFTLSGSTSNFILSNDPATTQSVCSGASDARFKLSVTGATSYQWYSNTTANNTGGSAIGGSSITSPINVSYLASTTTVGTKYYYLVVTNAAACSATSSIKTITVKATSTSTTPISVCSNALPYTWNGSSYNTAGTYTQTLTNAVGCDSVATLNLTIKSSSSSSTNLNICSGKLPYTWNGLTFNASGSKTATLTNATGCDSTATLNLTVNTATSSTFTTYACDSFVWAEKGNKVYTSSNYTDTIMLVNAAGCDSIVTLDLTINTTAPPLVTNTGINLVATGNCASLSDTYTITQMLNGRNYYVSLSGAYAIQFDGTKWLVIMGDINNIAFVNYNTSTGLIPPISGWIANLCAGSTISINFISITNYCNPATVASLGNAVVGTSFLSWYDNAMASIPMSNNQPISTGTYYVSQTANGCASSRVALNVTVNQPTFTSITQSACNSYTWAANGQTYTASGIYIRNYNNANGCASADTLNLTINKGTFTSTTKSACGGYFWALQGLSYTTSGTYIRNYNDANGCASADTLYLTINKGTFTSTTQTQCGGTYNWNGQTYNTSGTYTFNYNNSNGCASVDTLKLTINALTTSTTIASACGSYSWNGTNYTASGTYNKTGLTNSQGCDSVATLHLTINQPSSSSNTASVCSNQLPYSWNGLTFNAAGTLTKTGLINSQGCDSSATLALSVSTSSASTISISTASNSVCAGSVVTFTGIATNEGTAPIYQWKKNGVNVGNNSNTYQITSLADKDSIWCVLTSNSACATTLTAVSNKIKMIVKDNPGIGSSSTIGVICSIGGTTSVLNTNTSNGGVWSSDNTNIATVTTSSGANGIVKGISNGTAILTYTKTNGNGCSLSASTIVTVAAVATPAAITGAANLCIGQSTTLNNTTIGGVWSSLTNRASINITTGVVTGNNAGTASIQYKVTNALGCSNSIAASIPINATPTVPTVSYSTGTTNPQTGAGTGNWCTNRNFTVIASPTGGVWSSTGVLTINASTGAASTGNTPGAATLSYTVTSNGCSNGRTITGNVVGCASRGSLQSTDNLLQSSTNFTIYPNPAKNVVSLQVEKLVGQGQIVVTDLYGKQVKVQPLSIGTNTINISNLSKGFYLISTITSEGKTTKKLVVE